MHKGLEKSTCGQDNRFGAIPKAALNDDSSHSACFDHDLVCQLLANSQVWLTFHKPFSHILIGFFIALGARAVHGRAFGAIEEPKLDTGGVGDDAHDSPQGVDFANHLAFGDTTDGRVTAHLADGVGIHGE